MPIKMILVPMDGSEESARETLEFVAGEEKKHKDFLVKFRNGGYPSDSLRFSDVVYYKMAEYLEEPEISDEMSRQNVFLVASHRELKSYQFYSDLAASNSDGELKEILLKIANEELKHKEKMEYLYANTAFPQTDGG